MGPGEGALFFGMVLSFGFLFTVIFMRCFC